jgi:hypothetical protein
LKYLQRAFETGFLTARPLLNLTEESLGERRKWESYQRDVEKGGVIVGVDNDHLEGENLFPD